MSLYSAGWAGVAAGDMMTFGESETPLAYSEPVQEYWAIRQRACFYTLELASRITISGVGAVDFLQSQLTREARYLLPETSLMALVLDSEGAVLDVVTVFRSDDGVYDVQTSCGLGLHTLQQLAQRAFDRDDVVVKSSREEAVAVEGPQTWAVLEQLGLHEVIDLPFQGVRTTTWCGSRVRVARIGVTGEFGVEIVAAANVVAQLEDELAPLCDRVGLLALESAMLEVRHPNPLLECKGVGATRAGLRWLVDYGRTQYLGSEGLIRESGTAVAGRVAFRSSRPAALAEGSPITTEDEPVGTVVLAGYSPGALTTIGLAELRADVCVPGLRLRSKDASGNSLIVETASCPIVVPGSWAIAAADRARELSEDQPEPVPPI